MKKYLFFITFLLTVSTITAQTYPGYQAKQTARQQQQQNTEPVFGFDKRKLTFGGGLGMQFGSYTLINIAPQVGYNFSDMFNAGAGISYTYYKDDFYVNGNKYNEKRHYAGFNLYARFYPIQYIVLMVQPEASRMWRSFGDFSENKFVPSLIVGGGVRFGPMTAMIQYDVAQNDYSPYGNNIFYSIGYSFGF